MCVRSHVQLLSGTQTLSLFRARDMLITSFLISLPSLNLSSFFTHHPYDDFDTSDILAVRRTLVIREPCISPSSPRVLRSSVLRASDPCMEGHRFNSCRGLRFFSLSRARDIFFTSFLNKTIRNYI